MRIAVLGGGHGSYAALADLTEQGHEVRLWRRDQEASEQLRREPVVTLRDEKGERAVRVLPPATDMGEALDGAELVLVPAPAIAQDDLAEAMAPHLVDGQVVFLPPGTFGSYAMSEVVRRSGNTSEVLWAETGTLPWLARKHGPASVNITIRAVHLPTGVYPANRSAEALEVIARAFPAVQPCGDALSGALMNAGPIIHPPLILMNAGPLEHFDAWDIHNEGTQPSIRAVTNALDLERIRVREALGYGEPHFPLRDHYENDRWMYGDAHQRLVDSGDWREKIDLHTHRYMTEDTAMGLALLGSVASWADVEAPIAHGLLAVAGAILGRDLTRGARTLGGLGLADLSSEQLHGLLATGRR